MMRTAEQIAADYAKYRGKCKELTDAACAADPTLRQVRGHVFVPLWATTEAHWWCVRPDGSIYDPSVLQFPCTPIDYEEFDGTLQCAECGTDVQEDDAIIHGNYGFCCNACAMCFVGL